MSKSTQKRIDSLRGYPQWICGPCGDRIGKRKPNGCSTWHIGSMCGWCGNDKAPVTEPRDFGYPHAPYNRATAEPGE